MTNCGVVVETMLVSGRFVVAAIVVVVTTAVVSAFVAVA